METIAGALIDGKQHTIYRIDEQNKRITGALTVAGRWLYVRKCRRPEKWGGVYLSDVVRDDTVFALVLAVGMDCGKDERHLLRHSPEILAERRKWVGWLPQVNLGPIYPGRTQIMCPDQHAWGIMRSPYADDKSEYFVHECVAIAALEPDD